MNDPKNAMDFRLSVLDRTLYTAMRAVFFDYTIYSGGGVSSRRFFCLASDILHDDLDNMMRAAPVRKYA